MKGRKGRDTGGVNRAEEDLDRKNMSYTAEDNVGKEAEEKKRGGRTGEHRAKRARGGKTVAMHGTKPKMHLGKKPRKQGGGTHSDSNPYTSARHGDKPPGRELMMEME